MEVLDGVVWITQSNDPRDIVIEAGQAFVLDRPGLALVNSLLTDATIAITIATHIAPEANRYDGGVPIFIDGKLIGAAGVSGRRSRGRNLGTGCAGRR